MALRREDMTPGRVYERVVVDDLTRTQIVMYAGASGDYNPLHTDEVYAVHSGFPGVFAHSMLTMGLTGTMLTRSPPSTSATRSSSPGRRAPRSTTEPLQGYWTCSHCCVRW